MITSIHPSPRRLARSRNAAPDAARPRCSAIGVALAKALAATMVVASATLLAAVPAHATPAPSGAGHRPEPEGPQAVHRAALDDARQGRIDEALAALRALARRHPDERRLAWDVVSVASAAGRTDEALEAARADGLLQAPVEVLEAAARAARDARAPALAEQWFRAALARDPARAEPAIGLALVLADRQDPKGAAGLLGRLEASHPGRADVADARAVVAESTGDWVTALAARRQALVRQPGRMESIRGLVRAAARLGAPHLAAETTASGALLAAHDVAQRAADRAAIAIRWLRADPPDDTTEARFAWAHAVLDATEAAVDLPESAPEALPSELADATAAGAVDPPGRDGPPAPDGPPMLEATPLPAVAPRMPDTGDPPALQAQLEPLPIELQPVEPLAMRVVALGVLGHDDELRGLHARLSAAGVELPGWALGAAGDAHLRGGEPQRAVALYRAALVAAPQDVDAGLGLFYALVEAERLADARDWIEGLAARLPLPAGQGGAARTPGGASDAAGASVAPGASDAAVRARIASVHVAATLARVFAERPAHAAATGAALRAHRAYAGSAGARRLRPSVVADAWADAIDEARFAVAQSWLGEARAFEDDERAQRRHRDADRDRRLREGSGEAAALIGPPREFRVDTVLWSSPLSRDWRAFVQDWKAQARFDDATAEGRRTGVGLERQGEDWRIGAELATGNLAVHAAGVPMAARGGQGLRLQTDPGGDPLQLRSRLAAVPGRQLSVDAAWMPTDARRLGGTVTAVDSTNGHQRKVASSAWRERWAEGKGWRVETTLGAVATRSEFGGALGGNARSDASATLDTAAEWLSWRRRDDAFRQRLSLTIGAYWQDAFGSGTVRAARYEHVWELSRTLRMRYGVGRSLRPIDGVQTERTDASVALDWRF